MANRALGIGCVEKWDKAIRSKCAPGEREWGIKGCLTPVRDARGLDLALFCFHADRI